MKRVCGLLCGVVLAACTGGDPVGGSSSSSGGGGGGSSSASSGGNAGGSSGTGGMSSSGGGTTSNGGGSSGGGTGMGRVGDPCNTAADCTELPDMECYREVVNPFSNMTVANFPGGYCSKGCPNGDECGNNSCVTMSQAGGMSSATLMICGAACRDNTACRTAEGYTCRSFFGLGGYCAPP